jgi:hypothetical protein
MSGITIRVFCGATIDDSSVFFGPFLSSSFFPPNDRAQIHAQENPLVVLIDGTKVSLDAKVGQTFLNRWMIWEVLKLGTPKVLA